MSRYVPRSLARTFSVTFINYVRQLSRYIETLDFFFLPSQLASLSVSLNRFLKCPFRYNVATTKTTPPAAVNSYFPGDIFSRNSRERSFSFLHSISTRSIRLADSLFT